MSISVDWNSERVRYSLETIPKKSWGSGTSRQSVLDARRGSRNGNRQKSSQDMQRRRQQALHDSDNKSRCSKIHPANISKLT